MNTQWIRFHRQPLVPENSVTVDISLHLYYAHILAVSGSNFPHDSNTSSIGVPQNPHLGTIEVFKEDKLCTALL